MKDLSIYEKRFMNAVQISEKEYYNLFADQVNRSNFETVQYLNIH